MIGIMPAPRLLRGAPYLDTCCYCRQRKPIVAYRTIRKPVLFCKPCYDHEMVEWKKEVELYGYHFALACQKGVNAA